MKDMELVVRAAVREDAPALAARLRQEGARAVCIVDGREGFDWIATEHARGWLGGPRLAPAELERRVREAMKHGYVAADAAVIAKTEKLYELPVLSWGEDLPDVRRRAAHSRGLGLYAIVDSAERVRAVLAAGIRTVQLRIKKPAAPDAAWHAMLRDQVRAAIAHARDTGAELFINDHWEVAHELGASAVHLGQEDLLALGDAGRARLLATGMALGVSSHSLWELARARTLAPRYIACGPVWATITKDMPWLPQGLDNLAWWVRAAQAPVTAIGGILEPAQVQAAASTGVDGVCIVRGLGDDPRATLPAFEAALAAGRAQPAQAAPAWPHPSLPRAQGG